MADSLDHIREVLADSLDHIREVPDRKTMIVIIGNSDDKLSQKSWNQFVEFVDNKILDWEYERHFAGSPSGSDPYQNYCWVFEIMDDPGPYDRPDTISLRDALDDIRVTFEQDSILYAEIAVNFIQRPRQG